MATTTGKPGVHYRILGRRTAGRSGRADKRSAQANGRPVLPRPVRCLFAQTQGPAPGHHPTGASNGRKQKSVQLRLAALAASGRPLKDCASSLLHQLIKLVGGHYASISLYDRQRNEVWTPYWAGSAPLAGVPSRRKLDESGMEGRMISDCECEVVCEQTEGGGQLLGLGIFNATGQLHGVCQVLRRRLPGMVAAEPFSHRECCSVEMVAGQVPPIADPALPPIADSSAGSSAGSSAFTAID